MKDLLCTTDLTPTSDTALLHALALADRLGGKVSLLHVLGRNERTEERKTAVRAAMAQQVTKAMADGGRVELLLPDGDFMEQIAEESARGRHLLVMGTHGPKGLRQSLFGADILKLVRRSAAPSYVVQANSPTDKELTRIVLPVAGHSSIARLMDSVCLLAKAFAAEVHVFQLMRPGEQPSDELLANKLHMMERLQADGVRIIEVNLPSKGFSVGFSGQTIEYAQSVGAGCIAIMAHASEEYRHIADAEKERILSNDAHIPVLCA